MNLLQNETSPYLRQHKDNPVHWMPWGAAAFEKARTENKPILLSVGYSACHWCHVMAHESFEDAATADLMNRHFINIKLDREERPDIDAAYQAALSLMGKQGGWPLTMFLDSDGAPFWGGTYFPPQPRYGMPAFREVLRAVAESYTNEKDHIAHNTQALRAALEKINTGHKGAVPLPAQLDKAGAYFLSLIDPAHGGIGGAPKFPQLPVMNFLWATYLRTGEDSYKAAVIHSLTQMCQGGIYDHVGGGFARYSVDEEWLVPHFEKMLYDNAQFIALLTEVYKETRHPLFKARLEETVEWALRDLCVRHFSHTAFATAFDADSEGHEGKYYVWTAAEIDAALGADSEAFKKVYDVTLFGNWENTNILNRLRNAAPGEEDKYRRWLDKLRAVREKRIAPGRDDKVLADNNGLMIAALAHAGFALNKPEWIEAAQSAFRFIATEMMDKENRLRHSWCDGARGPAALLEDYANMAAAALALNDVAQAAAWVAVLDQDFWDDKSGGYFMSATHDTVVRPKSAQDSAVPAGNGTMIGVLMRLAQLTGNAAYEDRARKTAEAFAGELAHHVFSFATLLTHIDMLHHPLSIVMIGDEAPFAETFRKLSLPLAVKSAPPEGAVLPALHPAFGKTAVGGKPTAYVCIGRQCLAPVTTAAALEKLLRDVRAHDTPSAANDG